MVYFLLRALGAGGFVSLAAGALFAVHPVHTETVSGIVGRAEILAFLFVLGAMGLVIINRRQPGARGGLPVAVFGLVVLALLSKESAVFALPLFLLYDASVAGRLRARTYLPLVAAVVAYAIMRHAALGGLGLTGREIGVLDNPAAHATFGTRVLAAPMLFAKYLQLLFAPYRLSADYSSNQIPLPSSILDGRVLAGLTLLVAAGAGTALAWRFGRRLVAFAIGAVVLPVLGLVHVLFPLGTLLAERLIYLPSFGACFLVGLGLESLRKRWPRAAHLLLVAVVVVGLGRTVARNRDWMDNETLFRRTTEASPASARSHFLLGTALVEKGDYREGAAAFRRGLEIAPGHSGGLVSLGQALESAGEPGEAEAALREAVAHAPSMPSVHEALGLLLYKRGRLEEASSVLERALKLDPASAASRSALAEVSLAAGRERAKEGDTSRALELFRTSFESQPSAAAANDVGVLLGMVGNMDDAEQWHRRALELEPDDARAWNYLGVIEERRRQRSQAKGFYKKALASDPDLVPGLLNLASVLLNEGDVTGAEKHYRKASELDPSSYEAHNSLGIALARMGRRAEAADEFRKALSVNRELAAARENLAALGVRP